MWGHRLVVHASLSRAAQTRRHATARAGRSTRETFSTHRMCRSSPAALQGPISWLTPSRYPLSRRAGSTATVPSAVRCSPTTLAVVLQRRDGAAAFMQPTTDHLLALQARASSSGDAGMGSEAHASILTTGDGACIRAVGHIPAFSSTCERAPAHCKEKLH